MFYKWKSPTLAKSYKAYVSWKPSIKIYTGHLSVMKTTHSTLTFVFFPSRHAPLVHRVYSDRIYSFSSWHLKKIQFPRTRKYAAII